MPASHNRLALAATRGYLFERLRPAPGIGQDLSPICSNAERESDGFGWRAATSHHGVRFPDAPPDSHHGDCSEPVDTSVCDPEAERAALSSHPNLCGLTHIPCLCNLRHKVLSRAYCWLRSMAGPRICDSPTRVRFRSASTSPIPLSANGRPPGPEPGNRSSSLCGGANCVPGEAKECRRARETLNLMPGGSTPASRNQLAAPDLAHSATG